MPAQCRRQTTALEPTSPATESNDSATQTPMSQGQGNAAAQEQVKAVTSQEVPVGAEQEAGGPVAFMPPGFQGWSDSPADGQTIDAVDGGAERWTPGDIAQFAQTQSLSNTELKNACLRDAGSQGVLLLVASRSFLVLQMRLANFRLGPMDLAGQRKPPGIRDRAIQQLREQSEALWGSFPDIELALMATGDTCYLGALRLRLGDGTAESLATTARTATAGAGVYETSMYDFDSTAIARVAVEAEEAESPEVYDVCALILSKQGITGIGIDAYLDEVVRADQESRTQGLMVNWMQEDEGAGQQIAAELKAHSMREQVRTVAEQFWSSCDQMILAADVRSGLITDLLGNAADQSWSMGCVNELLQYWGDGVSAHDLGPLLDRVDSHAKIIGDVRNDFHNLKVNCTSKDLSEQAMCTLTDDLTNACERFQNDVIGDDGSAINAFFEVLALAYTTPDKIAGAIAKGEFVLECAKLAGEVAQTLLTAHLAAVAAAKAAGAVTRIGQGIYRLQQAVSGTARTFSQHRRAMTVINLVGKTAGIATGVGVNAGADASMETLNVSLERLAVGQFQALGGLDGAATDPRVTSAFVSGALSGLVSSVLTAVHFQKALGKIGTGAKEGIGGVFRSLGETVSARAGNPDGIVQFFKHAEGFNRVVTQKLVTLSLNAMAAGLFAAGRKVGELALLDWENVENGKIEIDGEQVNLEEYLAREATIAALATVVAEGFFPLASDLCGKPADSSPNATIAGSSGRPKLKGKSVAKKTTSEVVKGALSRDESAKVTTGRRTRAAELDASILLGTAMYVAERFSGEVDAPVLVRLEHHHLEAMSRMGFEPTEAEAQEIKQRLEKVAERFDPQQAE